MKHDLIIRAGAGALAAWRSADPSRQLDCRGSIFQGLDLSGINLSEADLRSCLFDNCNLSHASFERALLADVCFVDCDLSSASFSGAKISGTNFEKVELAGCDFSGTVGLNRVASLELRSVPAAAILYDRTRCVGIDQWIGWDKLRFLSNIRIFVPAYLSLTISVLYLNWVASYRLLAVELNKMLSKVQGVHDMTLPEISDPGWIHLFVVLNFVFLALAATTFLACPERILEYSRERWRANSPNAEILYDHASWKRPLARMICAATLICGGVLSAALLGYGIIRQVIFITIQST